MTPYHRGQPVPCGCRADTERLPGGDCQTSIRGCSRRRAKMVRWRITSVQHTAEARTSVGRSRQASRSRSLKPGKWPGSRDAPCARPRCTPSRLSCHAAVPAGPTRFNIHGDHHRPTRARGDAAVRRPHPDYERTRRSRTQPDEPRRPRCLPRQRRGGRALGDPHPTCGPPDLLDRRQHAPVGLAPTVGRVWRGGERSAVRPRRAHGRRSLTSIWISR